MCCFILCAHTIGQKCESYACEHAYLRGPNGDTYIMKQ
jgi:hypothetical protein